MVKAEKALGIACGVPAKSPVTIWLDISLLVCPSCVSAIFRTAACADALAWRCGHLAYCHVDGAIAWQVPVPQQHVFLRTPRDVAESAN